MKTLLITALVVLATIAPGKTQAQSCNSAAQTTSQLWDRHQQIFTVAKNISCGTGQVSLCTAAELATYVDRMTTFWNNHIAGDGPLTLGPRQLAFNQTYNGTTLGFSERMFVSFASDEDPVTVTITETGGEGKATAVVCMVDENNVSTEVGKRQFNVSQAGKDTSGEQRAVTVNGVKDRIITVHIVGNSVGNRFSYSVEATN